MSITIYPLSRAEVNWALTASSTPPIPNNPDDSSLLEKDMPGVMSATEANAFDVSSVQALYRRGMVVRFADLLGWEGYADPRRPESEDNQPVIKIAVRDLVAAVGRELAGRMVVTFGM